MSDEAVKLLEARILQAIARMRALAGEREALHEEVERLRGELAAWSDEGDARTRAAREALGLALAELRED